MASGRPLSRYIIMYALSNLVYRLSTVPYFLCTMLMFISVNNFNLITFTINLFLL